MIILKAVICGWIESGAVMVSSAVIINEINQGQKETTQPLTVQCETDSGD